MRQLVQGRKNLKFPKEFYNFYGKYGIIDKIFGLDTESKSENTNLKPNKGHKRQNSI